MNLTFMVELCIYSATRSVLKTAHALNQSSEGMAAEQARLAVLDAPMNYPLHELHTLWGEALLAQGQHGQAERLILRALAAQPNYAPASVAFARLLTANVRDNNNNLRSLMRRAITKVS